jgi:endo-1,4-beta-D-glucanase Y
MEIKMKSLMSIIVFAVFFFAFGCISVQTQVVGGYSKITVDDKEVAAATNFAIKKQESILDTGTKITLVEISNAVKQVVEGMNYKMLLKVKIGNKEEIVEVVVWKKLSGEYELSSWNWKKR